MSNLKGYTPTDRLTHSMVLMQAFAYRHNINLRLLLSGADPIDCVANPVPSRDMYDATLKTVEVAAKQLRDVLREQSLFDDADRVDLRVIRAIYYGDYGELKQLVASGAKVRLPESILQRVGWHLTLAVLLTVVCGEHNKTAMRYLLSSVEFDPHMLCLLPLAAASETGMGANVLHLYELIEGLPLYANVFVGGARPEPPQSPPASPPAANAEEESGPDEEDLDETSNFEADDDTDDDKPLKPIASKKRKQDDDDDDEEEDEDSFVAPDDESLSVGEESDDDDKEVVPPTKKKKSRVAGQQVVEPTTLKDAVKQRRRSAATNAMQRTLLPFARESDAICKGWSYDFALRVEEIGVRNLVPSAQATNFSEFVYWLNDEHETSLQCKFYKHISDQACLMLGNIGSPSRRETVLMLCKLVSAGRVIVLCNPRATFTGKCALCANGKCARCYIELRVITDAFSEADRCKELGITGDLRAGSHCGERFMRVAQLYWLLKAVRSQPKRKASDPVVRAAFACIMEALSWAKTASEDLARRDFRSVKFNAGPQHGDAHWSHVDGDPLFWNVRRRSSAKK